MELRLPLEMSPGREAAYRAVFGTWGFFRTMHGKTVNGHESEPIPGDSEGQGSLVCCSLWGRKELDMTITTTTGA